MRLPRKTYETRGEKVADFVVGFVGWFLLNGLLLGAATVITRWLPEGPLAGSQLAQAITFAVWCLPLVVNLVALILLSITRRFIALGWLAAFGLLLLIPIVAGVFIVVACFVTMAAEGMQ